MFKNMKIGFKLGIGFALVLIMLGAVSLVSYLRVGQISTEIGELVNDKFPKTVIANDIIGNVNVIARAMRNSVLTKQPEEVQKELKRIAESRLTITEDFNKLDKLIRSDEGRKILARAQDARKIYIDDQSAFLEMVKAGKRDEGIEYLLTTVRKTQAAYLAAVTELISFQTI